MTIYRMDHAGVVVEDLAAAIAFFVELGLELEGEAAVEGEWVDQLVGLDGVRADIAVVRTPDGHGRVELSTFHTPVATSIAPRAPMNTPGIPRLTFVVDAVDDVLDRLLRSSSSQARSSAAVMGRPVIHINGRNA
jgi:catechol 2,3-dioxygenase-like lactoylglutathione lyase family enzyme